SRVNLTPAQTKKLAAAETYSKTNPFDKALSGIERIRGQSIWPALSPWMLRRDIAFELGGFDGRVIMAEDRDLMERGVHYLRRKGMQQAMFSMSDLHGYHQDHESTGLFDTWSQSKAIIEPRSAAMAADPNCTQDVVSTPL